VPQLWWRHKLILIMYLRSTPPGTKSDAGDASKTRHGGRAWHRKPWLRPPRARGMQRSRRCAENVFATLIQKVAPLLKPQILLPVLQRGADCNLNLQLALQKRFPGTQHLGLNSVAALLSMPFRQIARARTTMKRLPVWKELLGRVVFARLIYSLESRATM